MSTIFNYFGFHHGKKGKKHQQTRRNPSVSLDKPKVWAGSSNNLKRPSHQLNCLSQLPFQCFPNSKRYCKATCHFDSCRYAIYYAIYYAIVGFTALLAASMQVCLWTVAAGRQARSLRILFFHCVMRQEISWFDVTETAELNTRLAKWVTVESSTHSHRVNLIWRLSV